MNKQLISDTEDYVSTVCRVGQGAACCRYLTMTAQGWDCGKLDPSVKPVIDQRAETMKAQGDNCEGRAL